MFALVLTLAGCQSAYYSAAEKVGYHKRDILVDRVESSRDAQAEAQEQFGSALEQLSTLVNFDGGDLEDAYEDLAREYERSDAAATEVRQRIDDVDHVAGALFAEWEDEIEQYSSARLKADSAAKLEETRRRYQQMISVMRRSEAKMAPVLTAMNDNVMYLKHNLNARAVASLKVEFGTIEGQIEALIRDMNAAIASSDEFIASMQ
tara:strand:+ start:947 stop:1564 length:618 start_codon:yes stop_codon:yes gene_type:complete